MFVLHVLICGEQYAFQIILAFSDLKIAATLTDLGDCEKKGRIIISWVFNREQQKEDEVSDGAMERT